TPGCPPGSFLFGAPERPPGAWGGWGGGGGGCGWALDRRRCAASFGGYRRDHGALGAVCTHSGVFCPPATAGASAIIAMRGNSGRVEARSPSSVRRLTT